MCRPTLSVAPDPLFNLSCRGNGGGFMSGDGLLILGLVALAVYMGVHWERARRAASDMRLGRRRVVILRQTAAKERGHVFLVTAVAALALFLAVRYG
jgi:hypothetical protein